MDSLVESNQLIFFVNGKKIVESNPMPEWTLLFYLRKKLRLNGTKEACGEGGCGSCTVMMSRIQSHSGEIVNCAINACLTPLCSVHGAAIVTVEGIGSLRKGVHPVQERIAKSHGSKCGFCTPGFVMSMYSLLRNNEHPTEMEMEETFQGNLCRCTGYRPILEGFKTFCKSDNCCMNKKATNLDVSKIEGNDVSASPHEEKNSVPIISGGNVKNISDLLFDVSQFKPYDPSQDLIFPPDLQVNSSKYSNALVFRSKLVTWFRPVTLKELLNLKAVYPEAALVGGNTEIRYEIMKLNKLYSTYIQITDLIPEMNGIQFTTSHLVLGARITFAMLKSFCTQRMKDLTEQEKKFAKGETILMSAILQFVKHLGDVQTRNVATIGGSIPSASSASDSNTFFAAAGSIIKLQSRDRGSREIRLDGNFFKTGGGTSIEKDEIITTLKIPLLTDDEFIWTIKHSKRKDVDAAILNCAIKIGFESNQNIVHSSTVVFNGLSLNGLRIDKEISRGLFGKEWNPNTIKKWLALAVDQFEKIPDNSNSNASSAYRQSLVLSSLYKFCQAVSKWKEATNVDFAANYYSYSLDNCDSYVYARKASQIYEIVGENQAQENLIGRSIVHLSAMKQATGEAVYLDDIPPFSNELRGVFVFSNNACAVIKSIDYETALKVDGVLGIFDSKSLPEGRNHFGCITHTDDIVFAEDQVDYYGQPIAFVVATTETIASEASKLVKIEYEEKMPPLLTIEDAIKANSFFPHGHDQLISGDTVEGFSQSDEILQGEFRVGGQKHFYMECCGCISNPKEENEEIEVILTTEAPTTAQDVISHCLGLQANKVIVKTRRTGGGFGGKETRQSFLGIATSLAAQQLACPVRCILPRAQDMQLIGGRHPILCRYKVGFNKDGRINAIEADIFANGGISTDYSTFVMDQLMANCSSPYKIPHWNLQTHICRTNTQTNTTFRGFGGPQGSLIVEHIMDAVAEHLGKNSTDLRPMHFYRAGETTPFGYTIEHCTIQRCWNECLANSNFSSRFEEIRKFNSDSCFVKRGISLTPMSFVTVFPVPFLNQGGALVMIYKDGSVSLNHDGCEMGQGLHTKMMQIASRALGIPINKIHTAETSTEKVPNTAPSATSLTADLNGPAIIQACEILMKRLEPYRKSNPNGTWEEWVSAAYYDRTSLSATGYNKLEFPGLCNDLSYGAGCSEVEIDCLTGEHKILRTDIVMDVGESLNPAIDIGQIEGTFMQGCGLVTLEQVSFSPQGQLMEDGPATYKIPTVSNAPKEFNVSLLRGAPNPKAVCSSKALGESPLLLGSSVFLAIKEAVRSRRKDTQLSSPFRFDSPATTEMINLASGDVSCDKKELIS